MRSLVLGSAVAVLGPRHQTHAIGDAAGGVAFGDCTVGGAEKTAQGAALTPITPQQRDPTRRAFQLYAEIDIPILTVGLVFAGGWFIRTQKAFCAPVCNPADLNRSTAPPRDTGARAGGPHRTSG